jgi:hypothetical protein
VRRVRVMRVLTRHRIFAALALCTAACTARAPQATSTCPNEASTNTETIPEAAPSPVVTAPAKHFTRTTPAQPGAPAIARALLTAPQVVTLHFSEPVTPHVDLDPQQFRLSVGAHEREEDGYSTTYYYDPMGIDEDLPLGAVTEIRVVDDVTLELVLSATIPSDLCDELRKEAEQRAADAIGLYLHFRDTDDIGIADADGHHLADIAPHWVERRARVAAYNGTNLPAIEAVGPIPCSH